MNTAQTWQTVSTGSDETIGLAMQIGRKLKGGEVIELVSDLGGGKTTFVKGLAQGMGSEATVHSPSFTLDNQYQTDKLTLHHFDFYRLFEPGVMRDELAEILQEPGAVVVVEWGQIVQDVLPAERLIIHIKAIGDNDREISFSAPPQLKYLLPANT